MAAEQEYQVVARRYRPQNFSELVGQEHIAKALANAIQNHRIGHAYLFTGARGVGKTSSARIFAKSLNCVHGPTPNPCNQCEICQGITSGEDLDVIEIDGASNRGIDQIRTLIQNVSVRPVRARFKIFIIDEVHMLTNEAFNALLKTLEEPPEHVKFIFCTTEVNKIPITILSRCQRFDFAGIGTLAIADRLQAIVANEGLTAEPEAIRLLARRANGSMRDGQSLLEQLLAFTSGTITLKDVHQLLGTANDEILVEILRNIVRNEPAAILRTLDVMLQQGTDPGQFLEQLFGCMRDLMALLAGCGCESFLFLPADLEEEARQMAQKMRLDLILAAMQVCDHTLTRMKVSTQGRLLVEMAFIRICSLQNLANLSELVTQMESGARFPSNDASSAASTPPISQSGSPKIPLSPPPELRRSFTEELAETPSFITKKKEPSKLTALASAPESVIASVSAAAPESSAASVLASVPESSAVPVLVSAPESSAVPVSASVPESSSAPVSVSVPESSAASVSAAAPESSAASVSAAAPESSAASVSAFVPESSTVSVSAFVPESSAASVSPELHQPAKKSASPKPFASSWDANAEEELPADVFDALHESSSSQAKSEKLPASSTNSVCSLEETRRIWKVYLSLLEPFAQAESLHEVKDLELSPNGMELTVTYPARCEFAIQQFLKSASDPQRLEEKLGQALQKPGLRLKLLVSQPKAGPHPEGSAGLRQIYVNPLIHAAEELFGGTIERIETIQK